VHRALRRSILALPFLLLPFVGCETLEVYLELPTFGVGTVQGVWLWRLSEATDSYERACRIEFGAPELVKGKEAIGYLQGCDEEHPGLQLSAELERDPSNPEAVSLGLWYMRWEESGMYKVSAYGDDGESALSETAVTL